MFQQERLGGLCVTPDEPEPSRVKTRTTKETGGLSAPFRRGVAALTQYLQWEGHERPIPRKHEEPVDIDGQEHIVKLGVFITSTRREHLTPEQRAALAKLGIDWADSGVQLGHDGLAHLCLRPDGVLQAVMLEGGEEDLYVSSDLASFNASLAVPDRILPVIATSSGLTEASGAFQELNETLRGLDAGAFSEREGWWPRVLDDVRHTLNFPFSAAFEYADDAREKHIVTGATGPGVRIRRGLSGGSCPRH
ncbi:SUKH-4 family immunity protein [Streptomyces sp. NPDC050433]|uniref:SUKH-4 family immunity protein n=1 Tax=Streptomyces sp. NPDC050433 TaxID=3365615 RepID=UPI00379E50B6